jgi:hypothetical protein
MSSRSTIPPAGRRPRQVRDAVWVALVIGPRVARDEGCVHRSLMMIIGCESGMNLGRRHVGMLLNGLRRTVVMRCGLGDDVDRPI